MDQIPNLPRPALLAFTRADLTDPREVLLCSPLVLSRLSLPPAVLQAALVACSKALLTEPPRAVTELVGEGEQDQAVGSGDEGVDWVMGGGLRRGTITELAGEAGAGKSTLALQFCLTVQLAPTKGAAIYLSTEGLVATTRLSQICSALRENLNLEPAEMGMDDIHLLKTPTVEALEHALAYAVPALVSRLATTTQHAGAGKKPVRLLVVDSIAAPFRSESAGTLGAGGGSGGGGGQGGPAGQEGGAGGMSLLARAQAFGRLGDALARLASQGDLAVLVVNQVAGSSPGGMGRVTQGMVQAAKIAGLPVAAFSGAQGPHFSSSPRSLAGGANGAGAAGQGQQVQAALGITWAHQVTSRLLLSRLSYPDREGKDRQLESVFGPDTGGDRRGVRVKIWDWGVGVGPEGEGWEAEMPVQVELRRTTSRLPQEQEPESEKEWNEEEMWNATGGAGAYSSSPVSVRQKRPSPEQSLLKRSRDQATAEEQQEDDEEPKSQRLPTAHETSSPEHFEEVDPITTTTAMSLPLPAATAVAPTPNPTFPGATEEVPETQF